ncbi:MAG: GldM family protein [Bacteroidota bacterium]
MKHFFLILFSFFALAVFSQAQPTGKIKISKSRFVKAKTIRELLPAFPKDCPITAFQFAIDTPQLRKTLSMKSNKVSSDLKSIVKGMKAGQKFFIENVKSDCKTTFKKNYVFIIT